MENKELIPLEEKLTEFSELIASIMPKESFAMIIVAICALMYHCYHGVKDLCSKTLPGAFKRAALPSIRPLDRSFDDDSPEKKFDDSPEKKFKVLF